MTGQDVSSKGSFFPLLLPSFVFNGRALEINIEKELGEENSWSKAACSKRDQMRNIPITWENPQKP